MKRPSNLSESLHQRLNAYALAASAAGVGMLALARPAEGKIVYTKAHVKIPFWGYSLDLNHDGQNDFGILAGTGAKGTTSTITYSGIDVGPTRSYGAHNNCVAVGTRTHYADALRFGARIRASLFRTSQQDGVMAERTRNGRKGTSSFNGPWANNGKGVKNRYLGLKFQIKGKFHYGWARLNLTFPPKGRLELILTGYAYETIPNKPIVAGKTHGPDVITLEPASLGHLARGASAIPAWRGKESR
jgi:hypothetical protein